MPGGPTAVWKSEMGAETLGLRSRVGEGIVVGVLVYLLGETVREEGEGESQQGKGEIVAQSAFQVAPVNTRSGGALSRCARGRGVVE